MADLQKISQLVIEVAEATTPTQMISQIIIEVAGTRIPPGQGISQIVMEVAYIEGTAAPTQEQLMRHGTWFGDGVKKPMWWAK